ncbi:hypothetical protein HID58_018331, partial [Brassica napus]
RNGKRRNGSRNGGEEEEGGKIEVWRKGSRNGERDRGREERRERVGGSITHKRSDCLDTDDMSTININSKDTVGKGKEITSSGGGGRKENNRDGGNHGGKGDGGEEENIFYLPIALLLFSYAKLLSTSASLTPDLCDPDERVLLLKLKAEFKIWKSGEFNDYFGDSVTIYDDTVVNVKSYPKTKSWGNSTECCSWKGVTCHTKSGKALSLTGEIPSSIGNLKQLITFEVANNHLTGNIPSAIFNLTKLLRLSLDSNHFIGSLSPNIGQLSELVAVVAHDNLFTGAVPSSLFQISSLEEIDLENNQLSDLVGFENFSLLSNLEYLYLGSNNFRDNSPVDLNVFSSLKKLVRLDLSGIPLSTSNITSDSDFSSNFEFLFLSSCNITEFPDFIRDQRNLMSIYLSNNNIKGQVPDWLWRLQELRYLDLHNNGLIGSLPHMCMHAKHLRVIDVSHNLLEGKLLPSLTSCSRLEVLNLESNAINDTFPFHLNSLQSLEVLVLRSNKFHGMLHHSNGGAWFGFPALKIIDVSHNDFHGTLPSDYFLNWTAISTNEDNSTQPEYIEVLFNYVSVMLMSKGVSMAMERVLTIYTIIDFSGNRIHGQVPESIGLLQGLYVLNLSRNAFTGHIPSSLANLTALESLDLSQNKLSGEIPPQLGDLSSLEWINVSHNQLVGSIPQGTQFQRQNCSSYEGNPGLYGPSLKPVCGDPTSPETEPPVPEEEDEDEEVERLSWVAAGFGFAPGIIIGAPEKSADTLGPKEESDTADVASPLKARYEGKEGAKSRMEKESLAVMIVE